MRRTTHSSRSKGKAETKGSTRNITAKGKKIREGLDRLLDEIDRVLEENAEQMVKTYVQRGGQ